jgi:hypothetical protein
MNITQNELNLLNCIALNLYQPVNGSRPESFDDTDQIWSAGILDTNAIDLPRPRSVPGICASLLKKGLVRGYQGSNKMFGGTNQDPSTIGMTEAGYNAWLAAFPEEVA